MPPLEGEVVERQRNRRGLCVNSACKPLSQPVRAASSPFRGAEACAIQPGAIENPGFRADAIRPYSGVCKTGRISFIVAHPLSFAFAQQLPQRGGAEGASRHGSTYSSPPTEGMYHSMGNVTLIVVPVPGRLETSMLALWSMAACFTMESPRPVPPTSLEWLLSTR